LPVKAASQADSDGIESHCALSFGAPYGRLFVVNGFAVIVSVASACFCVGEPF